MSELVITTLLETQNSVIIKAMMRRQHIFQNSSLTLVGNSQIGLIINSTCLKAGSRCYRWYKHFKVGNLENVKDRRLNENEKRQKEGAKRAPFSPLRFATSTQALWREFLQLLLMLLMLLWYQATCVAPVSGLSARECTVPHSLPPTLSHVAAYTQRV